MISIKFMNINLWCTLRAVNASWVRPRRRLVVATRGVARVQAVGAGHSSTGPSWFSRSVEVRAAPIARRWAVAPPSRNSWCFAARK